jgi:hypothetical protein
LEGIESFYLNEIGEIDSQNFYLVKTEDLVKRLKGLIRHLEKDYAALIMAEFTSDNYLKQLFIENILFNQMFS